MPNPYMNRANKPSIGKTGRASEKSLAKKLVRTRPASGAMEGAKGDIITQEVLIEAKSTTGDSLGVKFEWLAKITREAVGEGKLPALAISFVDQNGKAYQGGEWVAVRLVDFKERFE